MSTENEIQEQLKVASAQMEEGNPEAAELTLTKVLETAPENRKLRRSLGFSLLQQNRAGEAIVIFERLFEETNKDPVFVLDLAKALNLGGDSVRAASILQDVLGKIATLTPGWFLLGDVQVEQRNFDKALRAYSEAISNDPFRVQIDQCKRSLQEDDSAKAERILRHILEQDPLHVEALSGMAVLAMGTEQWIEAERLFGEIQKRTRYWPTMLMGLSQLFLTTSRAPEAKQTLTTLLDFQPRMMMAWNMLGTANELLMHNDAAIEAFEKSLQLEPNQPRAHVSIGNIQRVIGDRDASEKTFKNALKFTGMNGEAYWGLSNLKTYRFTYNEVEDMRASLRRDSTSLFNAAPMYFALAKANEDREDYSAAFENYSKGNAIQKQYSAFSATVYDEEIQRIQQVFNRELLTRNPGPDAQMQAPIFIIGMPRTGSTLVEQILASHSKVDATMELPFMDQFVREFQSRAADIGPYPESVNIVDPRDFDRFARRYLSSADVYRQGAPRFLDKMPNNFVHVGLIHLMFPNAQFIDVIRHPLDTCLSVFKQRFATGQAFSYALEDLAAYYRGYRRLMAHWDEVTPGKVHALVYENLVSDPEATIRALLEFCELEFEEACLSPEKTQRAIRTPSSEQVRQPISASNIGYWKHFEKHMVPLQEMLEAEIEEHEKFVSSRPG